VDQKNAQDKDLLSQPAPSIEAAEGSAPRRKRLLALLAIGFAIPLAGGSAYFLRAARAKSELIVP
jgi:hypothetical protein